MTGAPRIKLCGVTRLEDALMAVDIGVSAVGLVFAPGSRRRVSSLEAAAIVDRLHPFVTTVGVFANQPIAEVRRIVGESGVRWAQLHGGEPQSFIDELGLPTIKAISVTTPKAVVSALAFDCRAILFDGPSGGSGVRFDRALLRGASLPAWFGIAGGLNPDNVRGAIADLKPHWVDVSSGVESSPGIKDRPLVERFVRAVERENT